MDFYSPLRYPGGKGRLSDYIELLFKGNCLNGGHYVEPYAGGASIALSLLINEYASVAHINDFDYSVFCFWDSIINKPDKFCKKIWDTSITVDEWKRQMYIQNHKQEFDSLEVGFSTLFLNRTNRSGILKGGIIGGLEQHGQWKIDARFNKTDLAKRIKRVSLYKNRIKLYNQDAVGLIPQIAAELPSNSLIYFDPPYYKKGRDLYINFYKHEDHEKIFNVINGLGDIKWIVSYDNVKPIRDLYAKFRQTTFDINYHAGNASKGSEVFVFSDTLWVPEIENPTDKEKIKYYAQQSVYTMRASGGFRRSSLAL
jgi:DNA adenine methylase